MATMGQLRDRSRYFTWQGVDLIRAAMRQKGWIEEDLANAIDARKKNRKDDSSIYESLCKYLSFQRPPQKKNIILIAELLGLNPNDLVEEALFENSTTNAREVSANEIDLRSVSKNLLEDLKKLTTEALTAGDGIRFDFDDVFVPLGVVERQQKTKRKEDDGAPDRGSELYEEKVTPITHKDFFKDVLLRGNTKISNGKRIAVIGEAGAGKTTQLQKIGSWLLEESDDIPVWISLTDLGAKSVREYLFENWVCEAAGEIESAPQAWKDSLGEAIKSGKVWLLLDGVDEMTVSNPLSYLSTQLNESWLKNVRFVLTCRVNVWDGGKNALTGFDVYRNLDFDYPDDVYKFIGKWFVRTPELAGSLTQALEQSGKERIRDMMKNPLRLTLLCYSWQLKQGELPETKAGLYEWFVEAFYKWNKGKAQIELSRSQEDELNRALGELAKRAIDGETSRFRLTKSFIENVFREFDIDLFDLALKLNWLNEIGVAAEDPLETVYAFYHPSFQEYFAALATTNWRFFINRNSSLLEPESYRIFEEKWEEIVLFWIGKREANKNKQDFIDMIVDNFQPLMEVNLFEIIYKIKAYFIAAKCIIEFKDYYQCRCLLERIIVTSR
jgi:energy-coupling factor transporter ATP-binding protein EcfA2